MPVWVRWKEYYQWMILMRRHHDHDLYLSLFHGHVLTLLGVLFRDYNDY